MEPSDNDSTTSSQSAADRQEPDHPAVGAVGNAAVWFQDPDSADEEDEDDEDLDYHDAPNEDEDDEDEDEFHGTLHRPSIEQCSSLTFPPDAELGDVEFEVVIGGGEDDEDEDDDEAGDLTATNIIGMLRGMPARSRLQAHY